MTNTTIRRSLGILAIAALGATALSAHAGKPTNPGKGGGNVNLGACQLADLSPVASACLGYVGGNDSPAELLALVGGTTWQGLTLSALTQYKDDNTAAGTSTTTLFDATKSGSDASAGTLSFLQGISGPFVVTLKGGNEMAAYYMAGGVSAGTVLGFDIPGLQGAGFSHASVHAAASSITAAVPEPETYALMLVGLAAVGALVRRRG